MKLSRMTIGFLGGILLASAVFAAQLGLDNDAGWGKGRILTAALGLTLIVFNWVAVRFREALARVKQTLFDLEDIRKVKLSLGVNFVLVASIYLWYAIPAFENPGFKFDYYGRMAAAFKNGQVHLLEEPPNSLLSLSDPYDFRLRHEAGVDNEIPIDVTLYDGKYYLYWGPAPSLFLMPFSGEQIARIKDKYISYLFACGVLAYLSLFILQIWKRINPAPPFWFPALFALTAGLAMPVPWMVKTPRIYEAAIFGGQFFLIGGFYWIYYALREPGISRSKLVLGGIHWALAMGTRLTVWPAIFLGTGITLLYLLKDFKTKPVAQILYRLILFAVPQFIALFLLGWYNYARFDTMTEFGLRYQLANTDYRKFGSPFALSYIRGNLHNYLTYPLNIQEKFPYLKPTENVASNERLAGLIYTSPWILFVIIPFSWTVFAMVRKRDGAALSPPEVWFLLAVGGGFMVMLSLVLLFYYPATRYIEDFTPLFLVFTFFLIVKAFNSTRLERIRQISMGLFIALGLWSVTASLLLSVPVEHAMKVNKSFMLIRNWLLGFGIGG